MINLAKNKSVFLFIAFVALSETGAQVEVEVSTRREGLGPDQSNGISAKGQANFSNFTLYFSFLDDIFTHLSSSQNISEKCRLETTLLLERASEGDRNALRILDSAGKPSSGILEGGISFIGYYSECVTSFLNISSTEKIAGHYCLMNLNFSVSDHQENIPQASWLVLTHQSPSIGICIPSSCLISDLKTASSSSLKDIFNGNISVEDDLICHANPTGFSNDVGALCTLCIFIVVLFIAIVATVTDIIQDDNCLANVNGNVSTNLKSISREVLCEVTESKPPRKKILLDCLLAFSFKRNAKKIFTVGSGDENIRCIHGLKFLTMALIILAHTYSFATQNLFYRNPGAAAQAAKDLLSQIFANGTLAVDTFYVISGLLVAYVTLKVLQKTEGKFPILYFYFHRYFRLTPLMMMVIFISAHLIRYLGSGPKWLASIMMYDEWCRKNAWFNALYVHNFFNTEQMCLSHSWYLATDMQFYFVVPLILIPLHKGIIFGAISSSIFLLTTVVVTAVLTVINHYPAIPYINDIMPKSIVDSYYKNVYIKPYCRMGPYIIGILVGYMLVHKKELVLRKRTVTLLWIMSITLGLFIIYIMWPANQGHLPTDSQAAAYSSLARTFWGISIGWLIIACYYGYGGFVNSILSWTPLIPLSRLTYCAYLIHPIIMNMYYGTTQIVVDYSLPFMMYLFLGNIFITYAISIILSLMFESPFTVLEKVIISKKS